MGELAVITPSFRPDLELFAELHRSVLRYTPADTTHHVIVPDADREIFARFAGPRCRIRVASELLPRQFRRTPRPGVWLNLRRPWPPVRGWIVQQVLKIAATAELDAEVVLIADSDVVLVRDVTPRNCTVERLYRAEGAVHEQMADHVRWHHVSRRLLGLPAAPGLPLTDYVSPLNVWNPPIVRSMQARITEVTGRHWADAFAAQLQISEFILYGLYVDEVHTGPGARPAGDTTICHNYWERVPLDLAGAVAFADALGPEALGMMISAKSETPNDVRRAAIRRCAEVAGNGFHNAER